MFCEKCGKQVSDEAVFCMYCGEKIVRSIKEEQVHTTDGEEDLMTNITLKQFREDAVNAVEYRDKLLAYRKSLSNSWDYNAYVGILLGVSGPKHGNASCMNYAIGQGDNGNNTKNTLMNKGLMPVFEKYKGKNLTDDITIDGVEDEIISIVPEYAEIRQKFHEILGDENKGKSIVEPAKKTDIVRDKSVDVTSAKVNIPINDNEENAKSLDSILTYLKYKFNCELRGVLEDKENYAYTNYINNYKYDSLGFDEEKINILDDFFHCCDMIHTMPIRFSDRRSVILNGLEVLSEKVNEAGNLYRYIKNTFYSWHGKKDGVDAMCHDDDLMYTNNQNPQYTNRDFVFNNSFTVFGCDVYANNRRAKSELCGNVIEYLGYLFWVENNCGKVQVSKKKIDSKESKVVLYTARNANYKNTPIGNIYTLAVMGSNSYSRFISISDDELYFYDGYNFISMDTDGNNTQIIDIKIKGDKVSIFIGMGKYLVYDDCGAMYKYDLCSNQSERLIKRTDLVGYTNYGWLNFGNDLLMNVGSGERITNLGEYFGLKAKDEPCFINISKRVAYFFEENKEDHLKSRFVGMDEQGKEADVWYIPRIQKKLYDKLFSGENDGYNALYFNGEKIIVKFDKDAELDLPQCMLEYNRDGDLCRRTKFGEKMEFGPLFNMGRRKNVFLANSGSGYDYHVMYINDIPDVGRKLCCIEKYGM